MKLKLTLKFSITFLSLLFVMHEAHEIVHTTIGRIICGCWGQRDFNAWSLCDSCNGNRLEHLSTIAGPLFTFTMIWVGYTYLGKTKSDSQKSFGFALIFANMPFGRLLNPMLGGGDEAVVLNSFLNNVDLSRIIVLIIILLITIIPLRKCYLTIQNNYKVGWFLLFFFVPVLIDLLVVLGVMNSILNKGVLADYWILGSPILVTLWTFFVIIVYLTTHKNIYILGKSI